MNLCDACWDDDHTDCARDGECRCDRAQCASRDRDAEYEAAHPDDPGVEWPIGWSAHVASRNGGDGEPPPLIAPDGSCRVTRYPKQARR